MQHYRVTLEDAGIYYGSKNQNFQIIPIKIYVVSQQWLSFKL